MASTQLAKIIVADYGFGVAINAALELAFPIYDETKAIWMSALESLGQIMLTIFAYREIRQLFQFYVDDPTGEMVLSLFIAIQPELNKKLQRVINWVVDEVRGAFLMPSSDNPPPASVPPPSNVE